jgi:small subunit ribosomal protein S13
VLSVIRIHVINKDRVKKNFNMARLLGIEIPNEKRIEASLPYIYGIGGATAKKILDEAGIDPDTRTGELSTEQLSQISNAVNSSGIIIEGDLRRELQANMKRLQQINCYRGILHRRGMPVRGQRTKTNARTRKGGRRRTVGVERNPNAKKGKV